MSHFTILCVDDERNVLLALRTELLRYFPHCTIEIAESGREALALVEDLVAAGHEIPLVISDQIMPELRGTELLIELHARYPQMLKVMLTGQATVEDLSNVVNRGNLYRFLVKPWNGLDLQLTVTEALRCYQQEQQLAQQQIALEQANRDLVALNQALEQQVEERTQILEQEIQSRQQIDNQLRISEERYRLLSEISPVGIFHNNLQGSCTYANAKTLEITGLSLEENLGNGWGQHLHPEDRDRIYAAWAEFVERVNLDYEAEYQIEHRYLYPDGSLKWAVVQAVPERNPAGAVIGFVGSLIDITERKLAELALRDSERRYATLAQASPVGIFRKDASGMVVYANHRLGEMTGLSYADGQSESWLKAIHPDWRDRFRVDWQQLPENDRLAVETCLLHTDGSIRWVYCQVLAEHDAAGSLVGYVGTVTDITQLKQVEASLTEAQRLAHIGNWAFDLQTEEITWSEELYRMFGLDPAQPVPPYADYLQKIHPDDRPRLLQCIEQAILQGSPYQIDYQAILPDGSIRYHEGRGEIIRNAQGQVVRLYGTALDITDRKRAEAQVRQSEAKQTALISALPDLIMRVSDDGVYLDFFSTSTFKVLGDQESLIGTRVEETLPPELVQQRMNAVHRALQTRELQVYEQELWVEGEVQTEECRVVVCGDNEVLVIVRDVTDRKKFEAALQASEARRQLALDLTETGSWEFEVATGDAIWSDSHYRLMGLEPGAWPSNYQTWRQRVHPEDLDRTEQAFTQALETQSPLNLEYRIIYPDGTLRWVLTKGHGLYNQTGQAVRMVGVMIDVTERKNAEAALREREQLVISLLNNLPHIAWLKDSNGRFLAVNEPFGQACGYSPPQIVGLSDLDIWPRDLAEAYRQDDREVMASRRRKQVEEPLITATEEEKWIETVKTPMFNDQGEVTGTVGISIDITQRKRNEQILKHLNEELELRVQERTQELEESRSMLRLVLDTIPQRVFWKDRDSRFLGCNPAFAQTYQLTPEQIIGKIDPELPGDEPVQQYRSQDIGVMETQVSMLNLEELFKSPNGEQVWIRTSKIPLTNHQGDVIGVLGCYEDITDRKQAEAALRQLNLELEDRVEQRTAEWKAAKEAAETANRAKSIFLANMSHELRTPLNGILGFSQLLGRDPSLNSEQKNQVGIINRSGEHLLNLINSILEMSKIEAGRMNFVPNYFDLYILLDRLEEMFSLAAIEKDLQFIVDLDPTVPRYVETDENKLRQVLINLLGNAIKFTQTGQVILRISSQDAEVITRPMPLILQFELEDSGTGIAPDELDSLFEPFIQSKYHQTSQEGTGLGLPISRQFVQLMGGTLTVESTEGVGSIFAFTIPVQLVDAVNLLSPPLSRHVLGLAANQPTYRILVVEDNDTNRQLLVQLLETIGFEVQATINGQEAIARWESWQPHLIWMDMRMPIMDGYEATQQIRAKEPEATPTPTKIIALTASAFEEDRSRVLEVGCNDFVRKPFQETELLEKMAEHLAVQYLYAEPDPAEPDPAESTASARSVFDAVAAVAALQTIPAPLLAQLYQATIQLDSNQLMTLIEQFAPDQPALANLLTEKLDNFDLEYVLNLLQAAMPLEGSPTLV